MAEATVIDELVTLLGMEVSPGTQATVNKFKTTLADITTTVGFLSAGLVALTTGFLVFADQSNRSLRDLDNFNKLTGITTDTLQELSFAAEQVGGNASALESDLLKLTKSMSSPIPGEFNRALFMLGIQVKKANGELKRADEILLEVADKFQGLSEAEQIQWGSKIGISDNTLLLLKKGRGEIEKLSQQARDLPLIISKEQVKGAKEFTAQVDLLSRIMNFLGKTVASSISPAFKVVINDFTSWIDKNKEFVQLGIEDTVDGVVNGLDKYVEILEKLKDSLFETFPALDEFLDKFSNMDILSVIVTGFLVAVTIALGVLSAAFLKVVGAITAFSLIFEDLLIYFEDGDSAIGSLIESVGELYKQFSEKFPAIGGILESIGGIFKTIGRVIEFVFNKALDGAWAGIKRLGDGLDWLVGVFNNFLAVFGINRLFKGMEEFVGKLGVGITGDTSLQQATQPTIFPPPSSFFTNKNSSSVNQKNEITNTFHIKGNDPLSVAKEVGREMEELLSRVTPGPLIPVTQ